MRIDREDGSTRDTPLTRSLRDYLADPPNPNSHDPRHHAPDGIAIEYEGEPPAGAPFRWERRMRFIREVAKLAAALELPAYSTLCRLDTFNEDYRSPPLPEPVVRRIMAQESGRAR